MTIQLATSEMATIEFSRTDKTKEEFDNMSWVEQSNFLRIYADVNDREVQDWFFIKESK